MLAAITSFLSLPATALSAVLVWLGWKRPPADRDLESMLDHVLARDRATLPGRVAGNPLNFRPSEHVCAVAPGGGQAERAGRVEIVRTISAAIDNGYRVRLRAAVRGARGRTIMRSVDVELRRS